MKRRGFLQVLGAAIAAPLVPRSPTVTLGVDLAAQPDVTAVAVYRWQYHWTREAIDVTMPGDAHRVFVPGRLVCKRSLVRADA